MRDDGFLRTMPYSVVLIGESSSTTEFVCSFISRVLMATAISLGVATTSGSFGAYETEILTSKVFSLDIEPRIFYCSIGTITLGTL